MLAVLIATMAAYPKPTPLEAWLASEMKTMHIPGAAVGVYRYGKPVEIVTRGYADIGKKIPVQRKTYFEICSITKQFTAAAVLLLVDDGKMALDDPISKYVPGIPKGWSGVTIRRLLNHTSGVPDRIIKGGLWSFSPPTVVKKLSAVPLMYPAGDRWHYNNTGYWLAGQAIEKASGMSYFDFLKDRIFDRLGMAHTFPNRASLSISPRAKGYSYSRKGYKTAMALTDRMGYSYGGLISTIDDMNIWSEALTSGKLLSEQSRREMLTPAKLRSGHEAWNYPGNSYGLGVFLGNVNNHRIEKHSGGWNDASCQLARFLDDGLTVVMLTNVGGYEQRTFVGERIAHLFIPSIKAPEWNKKADRDQDATKVARKLISDVTSNKAPGARSLTETGKQIIEENGGRIRSTAGFRQLETLAFLQRIPQGLTTIYLYRATFGRPLVALVALTRDRKVADLQLLEPPSS